MVSRGLIAPSRPSTGPHPLIIGYAVPALILVTLAGACVRLFGLGAKSLWLDEAVLWLIQAGHGAAAVIADNAHNNSAPPGFALLLHLVGRIDQSEAALRLIPALASIAAIPCLYALSRALNPGAGAALCVSVLVALAPLQVVDAQRVREDSPAFLLGIVTILLVVRLIARPTIGRLLALAAVQAADLLFQYGLVAVAACASVAAVAALWRQRSSRWPAVALWVCCQVVLLLVAAAVYLSTARFQSPVPGDATAGYWDGASALSLLRFVAISTWKVLGSAYTYDRWGWAMVLCLAIGLAVAVRSPRRAILAILLGGPFALIIGLALSGIYPYAPGRQDIALTIPVYLLLGWGAAALLTLARRTRPTLAAAALVGLACLVPGAEHIWDYLAGPGPENAAPVVEDLYAEARGGDAIYASSGSSPAFIYYWCRQANCDAWLATRTSGLLPRIYATDAAGRYIVLGISVSAHGGADPDYSRPQLEEMLALHRTAWLFFSHPSGSEKPILALARTYGRVTLVQQAGVARLYHVVRSTDILPQIGRLVGPRLELQGPAGALRIAVAGAGFRPHETVSLRYFCTAHGCGAGSAPLGLARADGQGLFHARVTIPAIAVTSPHYVGATGLTSGRFAAVLRPPGAPVTLHLAPVRGAPGERVRVAGSGFMAGEKVVVGYYCTLWTCGHAGPVLGRAQADAGGRFVAVVTIPSDSPAGRHIVGATGLSSGRYAGLAYTTI